MEQSDTNICVVFCTCPDSETAKRLSRGLVEERLAACVNIVSHVRSVFRWQGEVQEEDEILLIAKACKSQYSLFETWLQANHPYDVPEILMVPVADGLDAYLTWVSKETA